MLKMLTLNQVFITLITVIAVEHVCGQENNKEHKGPQTCGGRLKGPVGIIQTPNFPNPFPVPIKCRWIIEHDIVNGTISIYFTQQYTTSGLTFTEYMYYDDSYKLGERRALTVTDENITRVKWLQVQSPVLVVDLVLDRLEGTQLRALGLLSVFGFNMTYAVREPTDSPGPTSCSAIECRLLGHCYARRDYQQFFCSCFEGYSGADCGVGPLCPATSNMCKNGGTCRQMGPAAVSCVCAPGYTGDLCESQLAQPECGIEECSEDCKSGRTCDCNPKDSDTSSARFEVRLQILNQRNVNISEEIVKQLTSYLKASNITLEDDVEVLNISVFREETISWVRVWSRRREAVALRAALARLAATNTRSRNSRTGTGGISSPPTTLLLMPDTQHVHHYPALSLHALTVNQRPEVWEGTEFILSCMAYGSPDISFTWYKDGVKVNLNGTIREMWSRVVSEDAFGRRMSVLGVSSAERVDGGRWACAAHDGGRRRCRALRLAVLQPPRVTLLPHTITVDKGDNVSITCLAGASRMHGALGFSWARERTLLALAPGREVWEDLYPAGSVLKLYNLQRSSEFWCQVSSVAGTSSLCVNVWALAIGEPACESEPSHGLRWPRTAPGARASAPCPPGRSGETTRFCEPKTSQHSVKWMLPDFSGCIVDSLKDIYEQFRLISYGYSWGNVSHVAHQYAAVLRPVLAHPGEGSLPLKHAQEMLNYLLSNVGKPRDRIESVEHLLNIYDTLLKHPDAFLDEEKVYQLQNAVINTAGMRDNLNLHLNEFAINTKQVRDDGAAHFKLISSGHEGWLLASAGAELIDIKGKASVVVVQYHNLTARLPSLRQAVEFKGGREMQYILSSQQVQLSAAGAAVDQSLQHTATLLFIHAMNHSAEASQLSCGLRSTSSPGGWNMRACDVLVPESRHAACRCRGLGTYALFTIAQTTLTDTEKDLRSVVKITVGVGGAMCLTAAALQLLALASLRGARLPVLLKAATAGAHSAAVLALLECDTRQMGVAGSASACSGTAGWVCAACWCAGCAALCAQPLLLQAELAARPQKAHSVSLLAGVSTLVWLTARLWGDSPLRLGAAAQIVCSSGCALLAVLCFALAICAALRLRTITQKVPTERRNYLADRVRVVHHTLLLLLSTSAVQAAGIVYAQPGERSVTRVAALAATALANGVAMLVCYVLHDEQCVYAAKKAFGYAPHTLNDRATAGDGLDRHTPVPLSLYIEQCGEVESKGAGPTESPSCVVSPAGSYWRAPVTDTRADIVQCSHRSRASVRAALSPHRAPACDLVSHHTDEPPIACAVDCTFPTVLHKEHSCTLCVQSNPDVSNIPSPPIKSCLKKTSKNVEWTSSTSLPSLEVAEEEPKDRSDIERVNREWNRAYDTPDTDKMLNKISSELDFLLNRRESTTGVIPRLHRDTQT